MKKIISSLIILIVSIFIYQASYAADASVEFNFTGDSKITQGTKTVTYTISLGEFQGIADNPMMGYEAVLNYDSNIFSSATVEGLNDWTAQYTETTKRLIGETRTKAEPNKAIAKITLTLKDDASVGSTLIKLNNILLTVNDTQDFNYTKEAPLTIEAKVEEPKNEEKNENTGSTTDNQPKQEETKNQSENPTSDKSNTSNEFQSLTSNKNNNTTNAKTLPKTGIEKIALIVILVAAVGIGCLIRYKSIETK